MKSFLRKKWWRAKWKAEYLISKFRRWAAGDHKWSRNDPSTFAYRKPRKPIIPKDDPRDAPLWGSSGYVMEDAFRKIVQEQAKEYLASIPNGPPATGHAMLDALKKKQWAQYKHLVEQRERSGGSWSGSRTSESKFCDPWFPELWQLDNEIKMIERELKKEYNE